MCKNTNSVDTSGQKAVCLVCCGLFVHPFGHTWNIGQCQLQITIYILQRNL